MKPERINEIIEKTLPAQSEALKVTACYEKVFGTFFESPAQYFINRLKKMLSETKGAELVRNEEIFTLNCTNDLITDYMGVVISTIIVELYKCKEEGIYSSEDIYNDFCNDLKKPSVIKALAEKYPLMFSTVYSMAEARAELLRGCIEHLYECRAEISEKLGISCNAILGMSVSSGDSHNGGKKVVLIDLPEGRIVYKPHSLSTEILFGQIVSAVSENKGIKYPLSTVKTISREGYGFQEFITQKPVADEKEAERYYYRIGSFSAIFDGIKCEDLHYENIICSGENPYFIDLETLIRNNEKNPRSEKCKGFLYDVLNEINESVLGTMLYPMNSPLSFFDFDMGGISASPHNKSKKWQSYNIINAGTDKIRFITGEGKISEAQNLLYCNGREVSPVVFSDEMTAGYKDTMKAVLASREKISELLGSNQCTVRRVLRPTAMYGKFLKVSYSPQFFASADERARLFSKLYKGFEENETECRRIACEIEALMNNDIPYFEQKICERSIIGNQNTVVENYNTCAPCENVIKRLNEIDETYINKQIHYIVTALSTDTRNEDLRETFGRKFTAERIPMGNSHVECAEKIAEYLAETAIVSKDEDALSWLTENSSQSFVIEASDAKMYDCGAIPLFFLYLGHCTGKSRWLEYAEKALNGLEQLGFAKPKSDISFFVGSTGLMYNYYCFYSVTGNPVYLEKLESYAEGCLEAVKNESPEFEGDVIRGTAGAITVLAKINRQLNNPAIDELLEITAQSLAVTIDDETFPEMTGMAHGYSGVALALAEYGSYSGDSRFTALAEKAIMRENTYYVKECGNWRDLRENCGFGAYWCHGAPGIGLSRILMREHGVQVSDNEIKDGINCLVKQGFADDFDHSLCHGVFGTIELLNVYGRKLKDERLCNLASEKAVEYAVEIEKEGFIPGIKGMAVTPSFMTGITGTGYTLLRLSFPEVPSVIAFEVPEIRRKNIEQAEYTDSRIHAFSLS